MLEKQLEKIRKAKEGTHEIVFEPGHDARICEVIKVWGDNAWVRLVDGLNDPVLANTDESGQEIRLNATASRLLLNGAYRSKNSARKSAHRSRTDGRR